MLLTLLYDALALLLSKFLRNALRPGLVSVPGPFAAKFSNLWRLYKVWQWKFKEDLPALHQKYNSSIIRIGPKIVSCSDPRAVELIYGFHTEFKKVRIALYGDVLTTELGAVTMPMENGFTVRYGQGNGSSL
jgi:hypothetical protein